VRAIGLLLPEDPTDGESTFYYTSHVPDLPDNLYDLPVKMSEVQDQSCRPCNLPVRLCLCSQSGLVLSKTGADSSSELYFH
jgi:hypothetical protein